MVRPTVKWVGAAWLASSAWLGCNAILGNEAAIFDPDASAPSGDAGGSDGARDATSSDASPDADADAAFDGGPCFGVDLDGSATSCGACGHSCLGGACVSGRCQPVRLATDVTGPSTLVRDGEYVYWINAASGDVQRVHVDGGAKQLLFDGPDGTSGTSIAFSGTSFYYPLAIVDGGILECPKTGCTGAPLVVANLDAPSTVVVTAGSELYFAETVNPGRIAHCTLPCTGGFDEIAPPDGYPGHLSVEGTGVYWSAILPTPSVRGKEGDAAVGTVATGPIGEIVAMPGEVFWAEPGQGPRVAPRDGGPPRRLRLTGVNGTQSENIAVTNDAIFFTEPSRGTVWQCPRSGCPDAAAPVFEGASKPRGVAADDGAIYFADEGTVASGGGIYRLAR